MNPFKEISAAIALSSLLILLETQPAACANVDHEVTKLPGWDKPLPSKHYSGYINVGKGSEAGSKYLHYWLILSEGNPSTDPLMLWLNGGPGTSSLYGMMTEMGQLVTNDESFNNIGDDGIPKLIYNPYGWSRVANVLFLEMPAGVGFSFCENSHNCTNTDESTADDNYEFLQEWFDAYTEFKANDFYIVGESYAGVYIPMIAERILKGTYPMNFKGVAIGNGCVGKAKGICADTTEESFKFALEFFRSHFMVSPDLYRQVTNDCDWSNITASCWQHIGLLRKQMGTFNLYNVYDTCGKDTQAENAAMNRDLLDYWGLSQASLSLSLRSLGISADTYVCGGERAMNAYLSHPEVAKALHVLPGTPKMKYVRTVDDLRPLMAWLVDRIRVIIYSGDVDACVPTNDSETWIQWVVAKYGLKTIKPWKPWHAHTLDGAYQKSGYYQVYDRNNFTFATFNGAGHMVPTYKPAEALTFISRWLAGEDLDQPKPSPTHAITVGGHDNPFRPRKPLDPRAPQQGVLFSS